MVFVTSTIIILKNEASIVCFIINVIIANVNTTLIQV